VYKKFSYFCKEQGISMSKQIEMFMKSMVEDEPEAKKDYLDKLNRVRKGNFVRVKSIADRYGL
jgi:ligand-binding sensor protein